MITIDRLPILILGAAAWLAVLAYIAIRRRYEPRNLIRVALGSATVFAAVVLVGDALASALVAIGALGAIVWIRAEDAERARGSRRGRTVESAK
jgi:hypothetical protein